MHHHTPPLPHSSASSTYVRKHFSVTEEKEMEGFPSPPQAPPSAPLGIHQTHSGTLLSGKGNYDISTLSFFYTQCSIFASD